MIKKYQKILILFILLFCVFARPVFALELKYPPIPGLPNINTAKPNIGSYVTYFFGLGIYMAGILALISFAIGAVTLIASADSAEIKSNARDRMKNAALGAAVIMASFIILRTINIALISPTLTPLSTVAGVYLTDGTDLKSAPESLSDTSELGNYTKIKYICTPGQESAEPALLIWKFPNTDFKGNKASCQNVDKRIDTYTRYQEYQSGNNCYKVTSKKVRCYEGKAEGCIWDVVNQEILDLDSEYYDVNIKRITCGQTEDVGKIGSFRMAFETPGIYYCLGGCNGDMCQGYMSYANTSSQDAIDPTFAGKINGVRVVNAPANSLYYGAIFHEKPGLSNGGNCELSEYYAKDYFCQNVRYPNFTSSVDIFTANKDMQSSGTGVDFYSEPFGWDAGARAGFYKPEYKDSPYLIQYPSEMVYNYTNVKRVDAYKQMCEIFRNCPGSIKINGNYLVVLYSSGTYCQTFTKDVPNLNVQPIVAGNTYKIGNVEVIPIK